MNKSSGKTIQIFFKMAINPQPLSRLFSSFQTIITIFTTNICKKCPSGIRWWGLNPRSSEHKYPPITTRPTIQIFPSNLIHNSPPPILEPERCSRPLQLQQQQQGRSNTKSLPLRKDQRGRARRGVGWADVIADNLWLCTMSEGLQDMFFLYLYLPPSLPQSEPKLNNCTIKSSSFVHPLHLSFALSLSLSSLICLLMFLLPSLFNISLFFSLFLSFSFFLSFHIWTPLLAPVRTLKGLKNA